MTRKFYRGIGFSLLLLSSMAFAEGEETKGVMKTWDSYKVITEKNIFSRYRTKAVPISERQQVVVIPDQTYYTLRGITKQEDGYISFIENSRTMSVTRFRKGDSIAEGKITGISLDYITYEKEGKSLKIEIGMNLEGQVSSSGMQYASSGLGNSQRNTGFPGMGQMPGGQSQDGMGQRPSIGQNQGGMGQFPSMDQNQGGMGQMPGQASGQDPTTGQNQGRGQGPGVMIGQGQTQTTGQTQPAGQAQGGRGQFTAIDQSQSSSQATVTIQAGTAVQTGAQQQGESSDAILERLKEKRKKELEE